MWPFSRPHHPWSRRWSRRYLPLQLAGISLYALLLVLPIHEGNLRDWVLIPAGLLLLIAFIMTAVHYRAKASVRRLKGRACGNCLFPLEGLPMQGDCPECGHGYSIKHTIACWKHDLGLNGRYEYRHWPELPKDDA